MSPYEGSIEVNIESKSPGLGRGRRGRGNGGKLENDHATFTVENIKLTESKEPGKLFAEMDISKLNNYDKYFKILISIITHETIKDLKEVPLFLRPPIESQKNYNEIMNECGQNGYLNFNSILFRLK